MIGLIGESFLIMELAKRNIRAYKLPSQFDYDFLLSNNLKVEVKTANITLSKKKYKNKEYTWKRWLFRNQKIKNKKERILRTCDYYILVCLNKNKDVEQVFIIPSKIIAKRQGITIQKNYLKEGKNLFLDYKNKWGLITQNSTYTKED